ncbi:transposase [Streptomyces pseudovenezuelae]|uniref:transposase n=1 Tax=Streptomyces pseudovenezuelae TaxID=67350 RepID=UPI003D7A886C
MGNKYTQRYTEEFKRDAIALVDSSGKTVTAVARERSRCRRPSARGPRVRRPR